MICDHFNLSWLDIENDLTFEQYYCLLAVALDADELEQYHTAVLYHGKEAAKKWKWASPDKAGTVPSMAQLRRENSPLVDKQQEALALNYFNAFGQMVGDNASGDMSSFEQATGRTLVYRQADGSIVDKNGFLIRDITPDMLVVTKH